MLEYSAMPGGISAAHHAEQRDSASSSEGVGTDELWRRLPVDGVRRQCRGALATGTGAGAASLCNPNA